MTESLVAETDGLLRSLFPLCRSLTGDGVRQSLAILQRVAPFSMHEVPSGSVVYDWVVPDEWNVRDAYVADKAGRRVIDFRASNLHLVGYSAAADAELTFAELDEHLHTLPDLPSAVPYRTAYYDRDWGFCLTHDDYMRLDRSGRYRVRIDADLRPGSLTFGDAVVGGDSGKEYLISTYCCHPSLANDNLSGIVLWALLLRRLAGRPLRHTYRFVIVPETIGAIAYLAANEQAMRRVTGGFVVSTVGGPGPFGYKRTFSGDHQIDRTIEQAFAELGCSYQTYEFDLLGSDERQYSSPYFRIPVATITKDKYQEYEYYHTSLDDLDFVRAEAIVATLALYERAIDILELDRSYRSNAPQCEPMLSRRGLYPSVGGHIRQAASARGVVHPERAYDAGDTSITGRELDALLWSAFSADGKTSLLETARRTGLSMTLLADASQRLVAEGLLVPADDEGSG